MPHPTLYQINTRLTLNELGRGQPATLDDLPDVLLDQIAADGFDWVWLLGIWQTGEIGRQVARTDPHVRAALAEALPDLREEDIVSSPFAVKAYDVHRDFGGDAALVRLRTRLAARGLRLMLDFVANHVAPDHAWVIERSAYFVHGSEEDLAREPQNYFRAPAGDPRFILAHGRDPNFDGWTDTAQLNYRHAGLRAAQIAELGRIAERCDGIRCDMAMLLIPEIFLRTWGARGAPADGSVARDDPFWPAAIAAIRRRHPAFLFTAEVYWDLEWDLQQAGFDYTYDKRLYDRLVAGAARPVREHLMAAPAFTNRCLRFLENHDEPRAATAFAPAPHQAAAVVALLAPGMRLLHEGQREGRRMRAPMQLGRRAREPIDRELQSFYRRLLAVLARPEVHHGHWQLQLASPASAGNPSHDQFVAFTWQDGPNRLLAVANYAPAPGQCYIRLTGLPGLAGRPFALLDLLDERVRLDRQGDGLVGPGLFLDLPAWGHHVFQLTESAAP